MYHLFMFKQPSATTAKSGRRSKRKKYIYIFIYLYIYTLYKYE